MAASEPGAPDWLQPIPGDVAVPTPVAASAVLGYPLTLPSSLGAPSYIYVSPAGTSLADQTAVLVFEQTPDGIVDIYESPAQISSADFAQVVQEWVAGNGKAGTQGISSSVTLASGVVALLNENDALGTSSIRWIAGGVEYAILGPSLTAADATSFGQQLYAEPSS